MSEPRVLLTGLAMGESPRWHDDRLWVADWGAQQVLSVDAEGHGEVVVDVPSAPISIDWLPDGRLLAVSGGEGKLLRREADGTLVTHADLSPLSRHAWNELVVDDRGNAYVNTIGFDMAGGEDDASGSVALVRPDGTVTPLADGLSFPNGMAITVDGSTLVVAESYRHRLTAFAIGPDGELSDRRVWADLGDDFPDGICLDADGAAWYADVPHQRCVRVAEGGEVLAAVDVDQGCFACMLGGPDGRTLHIVAATWTGPEMMEGGERTGRVLTVDAPAPAAGHP